MGRREEGFRPREQHVRRPRGQRGNVSCLETRKMFIPVET